MNDIVSLIRSNPYSACGEYFAGSILPQESVIAQITYYAG